jgi:hypothetical protein
MKGRLKPRLNLIDPATYRRSASPPAAAAWTDNGWVTSDEWTLFRNRLVIQRMLKMPYSAAGRFLARMMLVRNVPRLTVDWSATAQKPRLRRVSGQPRAGTVFVCSADSRGRGVVTACLQLGEI